MNDGRTLFWLGLLAGLLPFVAAHAAYLISAAQERVPWCLPYLDGCTSISRAAREGAASIVFKVLMLPSAVLLALFWNACAGMLPLTRRRRAMQGLGLVGTLFLVLYVVFLGIDGEIPRWLRRYGVTVYFSFTVLAQMLLLSQLPEMRRGRQLLFGLCATMLLLGLASLPLQHFADDRKAAVNAIEWCYALLMSAFFPLAGLARKGLSPASAAEASTRLIHEPGAENR